MGTLRNSIVFRILAGSMAIAAVVACRGTRATESDQSDEQSVALMEPREGRDMLEDRSLPDVTPVPEEQAFQYPEVDTTVPDLTDEVVIVDLTEGPTESDIVAGAAAGRSDCGFEIIATSPAAVGEPCLTTDDFMRSLGLTEEQISGVHARAEGQ